MIAIRAKFSATSRRISLTHSERAAIALRAAYSNPDELKPRNRFIPKDFTSLRDETCSDSSSSHVGGPSVGVMELTTWLSFVKLPRSCANVHKSLSSFTK
jgi:hypothetical protein